MRDDIDADADRKRHAIGGKQRGFEQYAGELSAIGENVVRPFELEAVAPASLPAPIMATEMRCSGTTASSASASASPATKPSVAASFNS